MTTTTEIQVCGHCFEVHAIPVAIENFADSRFDPYAAGVLDYWLGDDTDARWDTITPHHTWRVFDQMIRFVAADYLRNGDVECICKKG